jgi:hypothetical protein
MKKLLLFILLVCATVQAYSQEYPKVVLSGDYPDPSVMRDGEDYYMTHSPFYYAPGFLIWHSRDLMPCNARIRRLCNGARLIEVQRKILHLLSGQRNKLGDLGK